MMPNPNADAQEARLDELLEILRHERPAYARLPRPDTPQEKRRLFRSLVNVRPPMPASARFLALQDAFLQEETRRKGVTDYRALSPAQAGLYLWQGDITTLQCDAIVNAANSALLGCFAPCHGCIDNAIHTFAGVPHGMAGDKVFTGRVDYTNFELWIPLADAFMQDVYKKL